MGKNHEFFGTENHLGLVLDLTVLELQTRQLKEYPAMGDVLQLWIQPLPPKDKQKPGTVAGSPISSASESPIKDKKYLTNLKADEKRICELEQHLKHWMLTRSWQSQ